MMEEVEALRSTGPDGRRTAVIVGADLNTEPGTHAALEIAESGLEVVAQGPDFLTWDPATNKTNFEIGSRREGSLPDFDSPHIEKLLAPRRTTARQIDYLFTSPDFQTREAEMVMNRDKNGIYPSDHFAILATLRLF